MIISIQALIYFRESLLAALERFIRPYYKNFFLTFNRNGVIVDDDEEDEQVFAEYDEDKGVVFFPPVYLQRYAAVSDCLMDERWRGKLEKVIDLGYHDMSFIKYLKEVPGIKNIMGVDLETIPLRCSLDLLDCDTYPPKRENPVQVTLYQGNAADPDYRLIGCDAVIAIEMIEHMLPQDLDRLLHTIFGFIKPWVAIITTPNGDFNVLFKALEKNGLRRLDHFFEWSREQFHDWCSNIVERYPQYTVTCTGIGPGPPGTLHLGCVSQMAVFVAKDYQKKPDLNISSLALVSRAPSPSYLTGTMSGLDNSNTTLKPSLEQVLNCSSFQVNKFSKTTQDLMAMNKNDALIHTREIVDEIRYLTKMLNFNKNTNNRPAVSHIWNNINWGENAPYWNQYYTVVKEYKYPFEKKTEEDQIMDLISEEINRLVDSNYDEFSVVVNKFEIPMNHLMNVIRHITSDATRVKDLLEWNGYEVNDNMVIYSRLIAENTSTPNKDDRDIDWPDYDTVSDVKTFL